MLNQHWVLLGAAFGLIGSVRYATSTAVGEARPNLVTWTLWATAPLIAFAAQLDAGVGLPAVMTLSAGVGPTIVLITALSTRHHYTDLRRSDRTCAALAVIALVVWWGMGDAPIAVVVAVAADALAAAPTVVKAWKLPRTENVLFYLLIGVGAVITLLTITDWHPTTWIFVAYQITVCTVVIGVVTTRRRVVI
ncbi:hypothetical protein [Williamsia sterculiae]|uniref:Uncharacterized protein n=1 Tax=Williamsia sterculiae TaxID=1344003 RepID=A0A1N7H6A9_9NOCA|nr:hypothetical protein [Williamsia sterculiae]SIS20352.1 hypothetical protein SAMN05445060_3592 [Williamsia sterculiae]